MIRRREGCPNCGWELEACDCSLDALMRAARTDYEEVTAVEWWDAKQEQETDDAESHD